MEDIVLNDPQTIKLVRDLARDISAAPAVDWATLDKHVQDDLRAKNEEMLALLNQILRASADMTARLQAIFEQQRNIELARLDEEVDNILAEVRKLPVADARDPDEISADLMSDNEPR